MPSGSEPPRPADIATALKAWRQGDCSLEPAPFVFAARPGEEGFEVEDVDGFAVVTQTCDIVLTDDAHSLVQVAPLVPVDEATLRDSSRGRRIHYAFVPGISKKGLVADLTRVMTVRKDVVASWTRVEGCRTDAERRAFSQSITRKLARTAFPDDFVALTRKLRDWVIAKHGRDSSEGAALRGLWDIRVAASPDWDAERVELTFWFVCERDVPANAAELRDKWLNLVPASGRYAVVQGQIVTLDDVTARDWVESDPLDFEHLSVSQPSA